MRKEVDKVIKSATLGLNVTPTGETFATAPTPANANDNSTKIATTAWVRKALNTSGSALGTWKKAYPGYIKLSNGIIIQWGQAAPNSSDIYSNTTKFPVAFTTTNYAPISTDYASAEGQAFVVSAYKKNKTDVTFRNAAGGHHVFWIAIGY